MEVESSPRLPQLEKSLHSSKGPAQPKIKNLKKKFFFKQLLKKKQEGTYVYLWLIHVDVQQKTTKFHKTIILQLKNKLKKNVGHRSQSVWVQILALWPQANC